MNLIDPQNIKISDYNYDLPDKKIAKYPLNKRDESKLLVYKDKQIIDSQFTKIDSFLPKNSLVVFNNTKVIQARLYFEKSTGAKIEIFCLDPYKPNDYSQVFETTKSCIWKCMIGNAKKWKEGELYKDIIIGQDIIRIKASKVESFRESHLIEFEWNNSQYCFADILDAMGELPIPPYLNRATETSDLDRYQTLYSKIKGSVAAPTAGLHFTNEIFEKIKNIGCIIDEVTLHVGAGTFRPVKSETIEGHEMHSEFIAVRKETIENLLNHKGKIIAVGTTSVRTLESLYYIGSILETNPNIEHLEVNQWQAYKLKEKQISKTQALENILAYLQRKSTEILFANTRIIIIPGYKFQIVDGIITNFHQPQSTLLLLVSAFVNGKWKTIYNHALKQEYRFLSYGDSSLLLQ